jgi:hypothetical protein
MLEILETAFLHGLIVTLLTMLAGRVIVAFGGHRDWDRCAPNSSQENMIMFVTVPLLIEQTILRKLEELAMEEAVEKWRRVLMENIQVDGGEGSRRCCLFVFLPHLRPNTLSKRYAWLCDNLLFNLLAMPFISPSTDIRWR